MAPAQAPDNIQGFITALPGTALFPNCLSQVAYPRLPCGAQPILQNLLPVGRQLSEFFGLHLENTFATAPLAIQ